MSVTTYGYYIPSTGDFSKGSNGWMALLDANISRFDGHSHNGTDSVLLSFSSVQNSATVRTPSADYQVLLADTMIAPTAICTLTLTDATLYPGERHEFSNNSGGTITLHPVSGQAIGGVSGDYLLTENGQFLVIRSDGTNWRIVGAG